MAQEPHCECPDTGAVQPEWEEAYGDEERAGMHHAPGKCRGTFDLRQYRRQGKPLWLCSCCHRFGDVETRPVRGG